MANLNHSMQQFITIYVKYFRHHRTKKLVFPKPPNKFIKLTIPVEKWKSYQERKHRKKRNTAAA